MAANENETPNTSTSSEADEKLVRLERLVEILQASSLDELSYEDEDMAVSLRRNAAVPVAMAAPVAAAVASTPPPALAAASAPAPAPAPEDDASISVITSPFVGTFYSSPSPDAAPFTAVGKSISVGQTVCIVEAMKLMNEIESEISGTVVEILIENAQPVQYGDALFKVRVS